MTVTISCLYYNYSDAQGALSRLEAARVPHSDISIVANNSDDWFEAPATLWWRDAPNVDNLVVG